jgi:polar amino acid transport system substrate-binding protein
MTMRVHRGDRPATSLVAKVGVVVTCLAATLAGCDQGTNVEATAQPVKFNKSLHDRLPEAVRSAGVIRVATDASYAPASYFGPDGRTIIGFEPDLAAALGQVLGVRFEFINVDFQSVLSRLAAHQVDVVISAMTDTTDREKQVDFINYFTAGTAILVQRGNPQAITNLKDLCGKTVAVEEGTVQVDLLQRNSRGCPGVPINIKTYPTNSDALLELRTGRAAAVLNDYPPAAFSASDTKTRGNYQLASDTQYEPGAYGVAIAKDRSDLRDVLRDALQQLIRNGVYAEVLHRWSVTEGALKTATINNGLVHG